MIKERVFDTRLYKDLSSHIIESSISEDLSGLVLEAGDKLLEKRINPREFKIINGRIIDVDTNEDVFENWKPKGELGEKECLSAGSFYQYLLDNPPGSLIIAISPAKGISPYKEARINVGYRENEDTIIFYGIPSKLNPEECRQLALKSLKFSFIDIQIKQPDNLRDKSIPLLIPRGKNPWEFLKNNLPIDSDAWETIISGLPWKLKAEARTVAKKAASSIKTMIYRASSDRDYILAGAYGERFMENAGWKINHAGCSGETNTQLLSGDYAKDAFGNIRTIGSGEGKFVLKCGNCGAPIYAVISKGYRCPCCGGVYQGC